MSDILFIGLLTYLSNGEDYEDMVGLLTGKQICMDGKKLKGCNPHSKGNHGLYIVNAWVSEHRVCIGQKKVEDKSNEIEAIPALLEEIDICGAVVSIDAMGFQRDIADRIVSKEGHYLLALKENQGSLYEDALCGFKLNRFLDMA